MCSWLTCTQEIQENWYLAKNNESAVILLGHINGRQTCRIILLGNNGRQTYRVVLTGIDIMFDVWVMTQKVTDVIVVYFYH